jgi:hypothetical protein
MPSHFQIYQPLWWSFYAHQACNEGVDDKECDIQPFRCVQCQDHLFHHSRTENRQNEGGRVRTVERTGPGALGIVEKDSGTRLLASASYRAIRSALARSKRSFCSSMRSHASQHALLRGSRLTAVLNSERAATRLPVLASITAHACRRAPRVYLCQHVGSNC